MAELEEYETNEVVREAAPTNLPHNTELVWEEELVVVRRRWFAVRIRP